MNIINICENDYANYSHSNAAALRSIGVDAKDFILSKHIFEYSSHSVLINKNELINKMRNADIIQIMHSCTTSLALYKTSESKAKLFVYHTGTRFRQEPVKYNSIFNSVICAGFTDQTEFMGLGIKNVNYMAVAIDTENIYPEKEYIDGKLTLAHYPSRSNVKGTDKIKELLSPHMDKFNVIIDTHLVSHCENLKRMQQCDVYLELFSPKQGDKEYGCYGVTAFEAAAMGKIVVTQNLYKQVYEHAYGDQDVLFTAPMNEYLFGKEMEFLSKTTYITSMQRLTRKTLVERHGYKASGERVLKLLLSL